jgi:hypothetical protein
MSDKPDLRMLGDSDDLELVDPGEWPPLIESWESAEMLHQRGNWSTNLSRLHRIEDAAAQLIGAMNDDRAGTKARSLSIAHAKDMLETALREPR